MQSPIPQYYCRKTISFTEYANMLSHYDKLDETCKKINFYTKLQSIGYVITIEYITGYS